MNIDYTVTALMFPAIPLIMAVYSNRFHTLSNLIRKIHDEYVFEKLPITRLYVQFKSKAFYFEDRERTNINFGEKHTFTFFFDASKMGNYFKITEEEFFKP